MGKKISRANGQDTISDRLEDNAEALLKDVEELEKMAQESGILMPRHVLWKLKASSWLGVFLAGILFGILIVFSVSSFRKESRYEVLTNPVSLAEHIVVSKPSPVTEPAPTPAEGGVGAPTSDVGVVVISPAVSIKPAVTPKKDNPPASSSDTLLQKTHDLLERIKKGQ